MRIEARGCSFEFEEHGEGAPLLLVHGFPLSSEMWAPVMPALGQAARAIALDLRGFGRSDKPEGDYSMDAIADDVLAVADALGLERFVLGGHSMGGYVCLRALARQPHRIIGLLLVDTRAEPDTAEGAERRRAAIATIRDGGRAAFLEQFVPNLVGPTTRERAPRFLEEMHALAADAPDHVLIGCLDGMMRRPDSRPLLAEIAVPALVLVGEEDTLTPPESAQAMAEALPDARLAVIPGAGHTPSVERPIPTADAILTFLRERFPKPSGPGR